MLSCRPLYLALFTIVLLHLRQSTPYPVPDKQEALGSRTTCDAIDTYSVEWFLANTLPEHRHEIYDHALFYPRGTSDAARKLAKKSNGEYVTIWVVWPCWLYNDEQVPENKLRCIHRDKKVRQKFYENMSEAFARMARSSATVMHSTKDYAKPPEDGIWARTELEALVEKTNVDKVTYSIRPYLCFHRLSLLT